MALPAAVAVDNSSAVEHWSGSEQSQPVEEEVETADTAETAATVETVADSAELVAEPRPERQRRQQLVADKVAVSSRTPSLWSVLGWRWPTQLIWECKLCLVITLSKLRLYRFLLL